MSKSFRKPIVGLTMGDPAGIGPEILLKALTRPGILKAARFVIFGSFSYLEKQKYRFLSRQQQQQYRLIQIPYSRNNLILSSFGDANEIPVLDFPLGQSFIRMGAVNSAHGHLSGQLIKEATLLALKQRLDAVVTGPINKVSFYQGGWGKLYQGHTEMMADLSKAKSVTHMLVKDWFRVVHVTSHIPLKSVSRKIKIKNVIQTIKLAKCGMDLLGIKNPRIAVSGLNPHAGDEGLFGREEKNIILPAVQYCRGKGIHVEGPLSPDIIWPRCFGGEYDVGVAMYHDQGQIPFKLLSFLFSAQKKVVTVSGALLTIGLPFLRVSPCHGSAFDIAGKGIASEQSFLDAVQLAIQLARTR